jgi:hypothetical protein
MQQGWVVQVVPGTDESLGHYLGRFRRANCLGHRTMEAELQVPAKRVSDWERPSRRQLPDLAQLERLSHLVGLSPTRLHQMFPPASMHLETRLCPACYAEVPIHRLTWQQQGMDQCNRHQLLLLSACPVCRTGFRTPALWSEGCCERCKLPFSQMRSHFIESDARSQI